MQFNEIVISVGVIFVTQMYNDFVKSCMCFLSTVISTQDRKHECIISQDDNDDDKRGEN